MKSYFNWWDDGSDKIIDETTTTYPLGDDDIDEEISFPTSIYDSGIYIDED